MTKKYLIETSAVKAALGFSSTPHERHFAQETADGDLYGSIYIRMETIRRFICDLISYAELLELSPTIADAESWWGEKFGRLPKLLGLSGPSLRRKGIELKNHQTHEAAVEVAQIALDMLEMYDHKLGRSVANTCG